MLRIIEIECAIFVLCKGILDSSKDDFEDGDEVYEAIGEVLHEVAEKPENEVRSVNVFTLVIFTLLSIISYRCRLIHCCRGSANTFITKYRIWNYFLH